MSKVSKVGNGSKERTYKSVLFEVLPEAVASERAVSGRIDMRGLFYACRRLYLNHPERPRGLEKRLASSKKHPEHILEYDYFNNQIIPDYERKYGEIEGLIRDARGHLHEAHTVEDEAQEIGTEFVAEFEAPDYYYDKVLYVEKHGIAQGLVDQGVGRRYDMAVVASKGYGTEADRKLLQMFGEEGYQVFILHDCDVDGFGILANLQDGNSRAAGLDGAAIDLGMRLADARDLGLLGEEATRQKALSASIVTYLTAEEGGLFTGTQRNAKVWEYTRFELNEIPAAERLPFVERKLQGAGVGPKIIPPDDYLRHTAEDRRDADIETEASMAIDRVLDADEINARIIERFRDRYALDGLRDHVEQGLERRPRSSWRSVLGAMIHAQGRGLRDEIEAAVRDEIETVIRGDE
jgi:hypothetical protein